MGFFEDVEKEAAKITPKEREEAYLRACKAARPSPIVFGWSGHVPGDEKPVIEELERRGCKLVATRVVPTKDF